MPMHNDNVPIYREVRPGLRYDQFEHEEDSDRDRFINELVLNRYFTEPPMGRGILMDRRFSRGFWEKVGDQIHWVWSGRLGLRLRLGSWLGCLILASLIFWFWLLS